MGGGGRRGESGEEVESAKTEAKTPMAVRSWSIVV